VSDPVYCLLDGGLRVDALGAGGEIPRLGSAAGLLADPSRTVGDFSHKEMVWAEHHLANRKSAMQTSTRTGHPNVN
jgi:hypothetical protein